MKFSFRTGIYLVLATAIATLVAIGGAYQLRVTGRVEQANAEAQSQRIIAKLGGRIGFVSTPGVGTTFYFDLDAHPQAAHRNAEAGGATRAA